VVIIHTDANLLQNVMYTANKTASTTDFECLNYLVLALFNVHLQKPKLRQLWDQQKSIFRHRIPIRAYKMSVYISESLSTTQKLCQKDQLHQKNQSEQLLSVPRSAISNTMADPEARIESSGRYTRPYLIKPHQKLSIFWSFQTILINFLLNTDFSF